MIVRGVILRRAFGNAPADEEHRGSDQQHDGEAGSQQGLQNLVHKKASLKMRWQEHPPLVATPPPPCRAWLDSSTAGPRSPASDASAR